MVTSSFSKTRGVDCSQSSIFREIVEIEDCALRAFILVSYVPKGLASGFVKVGEERREK